MRVLTLLSILAIFAAPAAASIESLHTEAEIATAAGEAGIAINKLRQILELAPDDGASHFRIGTLLMDNNGDPLDAIGHFEQARQLDFQPMGVALRLARIFARTGRTNKALEQMEVLASGGFGLLHTIDGESDFDGIRDDERFVAAVESIARSRYPCMGDSRHHAFDFWIGEWDVMSNGQLAGSNSIQPILGHCTLLEQWESVAGTSGKSFNYYDPGHDHWRQIWLDDSGTVIEFTGEARDGGIFFTAETINSQDGSVILHKFEFTRIDGGVVRQYWETSTDDGETWSAIWDGRYERKTD